MIPGSLPAWVSGPGFNAAAWGMPSEKGLPGSAEIPPSPGRSPLLPPGCAQCQESAPKVAVFLVKLRQYPRHPTGAFQLALLFIDSVSLYPHSYSVEPAGRDPYSHFTVKENEAQRS